MNDDVRKALDLHRERRANSDAPRADHDIILERIRYGRRAAQDDAILRDFEEGERVRSYLRRAILHKAFELDSDLSESEEKELQFDEYRPGSANTELPKYFEAQLKTNFAKHYLTPYDESELAKFALFKVRGIDAGFAIKPDGDICSVFNNSGVKGLARPMLKKAIAEGGVTLDHFDGKLSHIYDDLFEVVKRDAWDDQYAPEGWGYQPLEARETSYRPDFEKHKEGELPDELRAVGERYKSGRPDIVYRRARQRQAA